MLQEIISEPWLFCFSVFQVWNQSSVTQVCVHIKEILWSVINNGSGVQFLSVIIQAVFDKVKQPCSGSPIYLIMRMITGQMRWHKVLFIINKKFVIIKAFFILPLLIKICIAWYTCMVYHTCICHHCIKFENKLLPPRTSRSYSW